MHLVHTNRAPQFLSDSIQTVARSSSPVDLVSDPPTQLSTPSRAAEPSSERAASLMLVLCWTYTAWNSLPHHLHQISDTGLFKRRLKTELFRRAYVASY